MKRIALSLFIFSLFLRPALAQRPLPFVRSIDVMKYTRDVMTHQPSDAEIDNLVAVFKSLNVDAVALCVPMDPSSDYPADQKPAPRDAYVLTQRWADAVHNAGLRVLWRGTWSGIEGVTGFEKRVGARRFPTGTALSAPSDGNTTWLGKTYQYIVQNPGFFADGDLWAPLPERTEAIFQDSTSFLPHDGPGVQENYVRFFSDLKAVSDAGFRQIGKWVITGMSANNYTEVKSSWLPRVFFEIQGVTVIDYYGLERTAEEFERDIRLMHAKHGRPVFIQEWSDFWNGQLLSAKRASYQKGFYSAVRRLADEGILIGFNYWGGWTDTGESIIELKDGRYVLNEQGELLKEFFATFDRPAEARQ